MSQPWPPNTPPPYPHYGAVPTAPRTWLGTASFVSGLLAWTAIALGIYFLVASHEVTAGCLVDEGMRTAAILTAPVGALLSIIAVATGFSGLFGRGRTRGVYRLLGIVGLTMGLIALLASAGLWLGATTGGAANPRYLHPC